MEQPLRQAYEQAGITEREITIENVHLIRSTNAVEISCTLAAPLPEERLCCLAIPRPSPIRSALWRRRRP